ncbi:MAG: LVIVD repeat-containing protein [Thermoplasmatota archaeon]
MARAALLIAVTALLAAPLLAGCITAPNGAVIAQSHPAADSGLLMAQNASLWPDHENEPHPAFNWPTITHPAIGGKVPYWWQPIPNATVPSQITGLNHVAQTGGVPAGAGIAVFGRIALVPTDGPKEYVVNLTDPTHPSRLSEYDAGGERGAAIMAFPDGRLYGVVSTTPGFDVVNLTDPTNPKIVANVTAKCGGHKLGIVPGTPYVYNANSKGGSCNGPLFGVQGDVPAAATGEIEIYNLIDPTHPALVQNFQNGYGCHHIFFWIDAAQDKERAICAGIEATQLIDIKDPAHPKVITTIPFPIGNPMLPGASVAPIDFSHFSILSQDGKILIVGDEFMGGSTAECDGVHTPVADTGGKIGNLWFYDVSDEKNPRVLGSFAPPPHMITNPQPRIGCTAHHGRLVPDPSGKRQLIAMAWYGDGVVLIDFTNPSMPRMVDMWNQGTNTWEVWYDNGYLFTGDLSRGLDAFTLK